MDFNFQTGHVYCIGSTGVGKSTLLTSQAKGAFAFIDKHGTTARELADSMRCVYWRPADLSDPIGLNPLHNVPPDLRWKLTADIVSIFADVWGLGESTPRLLYYLRAAIRLLLDTQGTTLLDIRRVLSDGSFRTTLLKACSDQQTKTSWTEFNTKPARQQAEEISSLQNKVAALAAPLPLQYVLGQPTSTLDLSRVLSHGTSVIVDLSGMGDEPAHLLGAIIINTFKQEAENLFANTGKMVGYRLYIDEFQNFGTSIIATILSESRKFGLSLTLAHQFISQLDPQIRDAVLGNSSTIVSFRVGAKDAPPIAEAIDCPAQVLMDLKVGEARARLLFRGAPTNALVFEPEMPKLATGFLEGNIRHTRAAFARPREMVEEMLLGREKPRRAASWSR